MMSSAQRAVGSWLVFVVTATGCGEGDQEGEGGASATPSAVVEACEGLCDAQGEGMGCTEAIVADCKELCALQAAKSGACADATADSFQCRAQMTWRCSSGSDLAVSFDTTCDEEMSAAEAACGH